ncbi:MAG: DsrE family protein [Verrucomicrobiales bacterium]|nr:DsrE family protein [Verrucomicrobiota bacterium JB025]
MINYLLKFVLALVLFLSFAGSDRLAAAEEPSTLVVVWTSGDPDVAHRVALMYAHAAKKSKWFEHVRLIVWGPSQRLLVGDKALKAKIAQMKKDGVIVEACVACAQSFGLVDELRELDLTVKGMGQPLSDSLKDPDCAVITY